MESARLQIARVFGIPVYIHASWLIIFGLITWTLAIGYFPARYPDLPAASYWARGLITSLLFFVSIFLHEMGHALVAQRHGVRIRSITLFIFGGVSQMEGDPPDGGTEVRIAAVGPLVSLVLAGLFYLLSTAGLLGPASRSVAGYLALINLVLALFNLVPAFPLDGGRILRGLLWRHAGRLGATRIAASAGGMLAMLLMVWGVFRFLAGDGLAGIWSVLIGWFLREAAAGAHQQARLDETLGGMTAADIMLSDVATLPAHISVAEAAQEHFLRSGHGGYPVVRGEEVVGLLSLRDVLRLGPEERQAMSVQAAMKPLSEAVVVRPQTPLREALARMAAGPGRALVLENGRLVGFLTLSTVMRHLRVREALGA
jgi:Zn-dependent protease/predicted transcriptional regulator